MTIKVLFCIFIVWMTVTNMTLLGQYALSTHFFQECHSKQSKLQNYKLPNSSSHHSYSTFWYADFRKLRHLDHHFLVKPLIFQILVSDNFLDTYTTCLGSLFRLESTYHPLIASVEIMPASSVNRDFQLIFTFFPIYWPETDPVQSWYIRPYWTLNASYNYNCT